MGRGAEEGAGVMAIRLSSRFVSVHSRSVLYTAWMKLSMYNIPLAYPIPYPTLKETSKVGYPTDIPG